MVLLQENRSCYASPEQRDVLLGLLGHPIVEGNFFLTGGTALSVFYLHHRLSDDLDFFTREPAEMADLEMWITRHWPGRAAVRAHYPEFTRVEICGVKVEFVVDQPSFATARPKHRFENGHSLAVDTVPDIASNKLCAAAERGLPKDLIDLFCIQTGPFALSLSDLFDQGRRKAAILDDPPTAAFQIERAVQALDEGQVAWPPVLVPLDADRFFNFFRDLVGWLYRQGRP